MHSVAADAIAIIEKEMLNSLWLEILFVLKSEKKLSYVGRIYFSGYEGINLIIRNLDGDTAFEKKRISDIGTALQLAVTSVEGARLCIDTLTVLPSDSTGREKCLSPVSEFFVAISKALTAFCVEAPLASETNVSVIGALEKEFERYTKAFGEVWSVYGETIFENCLQLQRKGNRVHVSFAIYNYKLEYRVDSIKQVYAVACEILPGELLLNTLLVRSLELNKHEYQSGLETGALLSALAEFFSRAGGVELDSSVVGLQAKDVRDKLMAEYHLKMLKNGEVKNFNESRNRAGVEFKNADLQQAKLSGLEIYGTDFEQANLSGCNLSKSISDYANFSRANFSGANLSNAKFRATANGANFTGANLKKAKLTKSDLSGADFTNADLSGCELNETNLCGANLANCNASQAKSFAKTRYDEKTRFPEDFNRWDELLWCGEGADPYLASLINAATEMDFSTFLAAIENFEREGKVKNALKMLKAGSFSLFSEQVEGRLTGVVKSQTDADLVYACSIGQDGGFTCCTQNLRPCGGLKGTPCKHIYVMVIGLVKAAQVSPSDVMKRLLASESQKAVLEKDAMTGVFLKYKGAESGEIDWRPTETIPEDYY